MDTTIISNVFILISTTILLIINFSEIGYVNRLLSVKNHKKINVKKLSKIIYIPYYGKLYLRRQVWEESVLLGDKNFDGTVYKLTLILTIINYILILINISLFIISLLFNAKKLFILYSIGQYILYHLILQGVIKWIEIKNLKK